MLVDKAYVLRPSEHLWLPLTVQKPNIIPKAAKSNPMLIADVDHRAHTDGQHARVDAERLQAQNVLYTPMPHQLCTRMP